MTKTTTFRVGLMIAAALTAGGCSILKKGRPKTPVLGQRIAVLTSEGDVAVDPATAALPMTLPDPVANADWTQSGGNASKSVGQLALGTALGRAFTVQAGRGSSLTARLASEPVVAGGRVYTIDTLGAVRAFDGRTGGLLWASQTPNDRGNEASLYGGGIAYDNGRIYATNGLGYVAALDIRTGGIVWQVRPGGPLRGAPSIAGDAIYVMSQDNPDLLAQGIRRLAQLVASRIAGDCRRVRFGCSGCRPGHGRRRFLLGRTQRLSLREWPDGVAGRASAHQHPDQRVIAVRHRRRSGDRPRPGDRDWPGRAHGRARYHHRPAPVGTQYRGHLRRRGSPATGCSWSPTDAKLLCIARSNGHIRWINQLPQFEHPKRRRRARSTSTGPILAGDRLIVVGSNGVMINIDPVDRLVPDDQTSAGAGISQGRSSPTSTLYIYDDCRPLDRVPVSTSTAGRCPAIAAAMAVAHRRHRRPAQRRQVDPVQPARRQAAGAGRRPPGRDPRPPRGRGAICSGSTFRVIDTAGFEDEDPADPARPDARADRGGACARPMWPCS